MIEIVEIKLKVFRCIEGATAVTKEVKSEKMQAM
jgi:hypothetical protein